MYSPEWVYKYTYTCETHYQDCITIKIPLFIISLFVCNMQNTPRGCKWLNPAAARKCSYHFQVCAIFTLCLCMNIVVGVDIPVWCCHICLFRITRSTHCLSCIVTFYINFYFKKVFLLYYLCSVETKTVRPFPPKIHSHYIWTLCWSIQHWLKCAWMFIMSLLAQATLGRACGWRPYQLLEHG